MNNEETIIMQPKNNEKAQQIQSVETPKQEEKKSGNGKKVAAMTGAAVFGGAAGGAGTAAAANMFNKEQEEEEQEQEVKVEEDTPATTTTAKPEPKVEEKIETEEIPVTVDENGETDYTGNAGADPVTQNPTSTSQQTGNDGSDAHEVQVLGVYENGEGQEMAILTDGETVAAVLDANGDGEANVIGIDENMNGQLEEGEIHDISDQHISMSQYEDAYLAQQQQEQIQQEHETFAYNADDQQDYNNDAPDLSFA